MTNMNRFLRLKHIFIFNKVQQSNKKRKRYVVVNCAAQPSNLVKNLCSITIVYILEVWKVNAKIERGCVIHRSTTTPSGNVELRLS